MNIGLLTILSAITLCVSIIWHCTHPTTQVSFIKGKTMNMKVFIIMWAIAIIIGLVLDNWNGGEANTVGIWTIILGIALAIAIVGTIIERLPESQPQLPVSDHQATKLPDKMTRTIFREVVFCDMDLRGKIFEECDLREADFRRANLENAQFIRCDIRGTNFIEANMTNVKMPGSVYNVYNSQSTPKEKREDEKVRQILGWDNADLETGKVEESY